MKIKKLTDLTFNLTRYELDGADFDIALGSETNTALHYAPWSNLIPSVDGEGHTYHLNWLDTGAIDAGLTQLELIGI